MLSLIRSGLISLKEGTKRHGKDTHFFLILMRNLVILFLFCLIFSVSAPLGAQTEAEILELIDPDNFSEAAYARLVEMVHDLQIENHLTPPDSLPDSLRFHRHPKHTLILSGKADADDFDSHKETVRYDIRLTQGDNAWRAGLVNRHYYASLTRQKGWLRQALVGHYRLSMGSGLICNQRFSLGKNLAGKSFFQKSLPLSVHSSTLDDGYMQGVALRLRPFSHWEVLPFVSVQKVDDDKGRIMTNTGGRVRWLGEWFEVGGNVLYTLLQHDYVRAERQYNHNWFRGHQLVQGSIDYEALWLGMHLRGETAVDDGGGWATVNALHYTLFDDWNLTALFRQYSNHYRQLLGSSVAEASAMQGERGEMLQVDGGLSAHWSLQASADWFHFTQPQYGIYQPSDGYELACKLLYNRTFVRHTWQASLHYRLKAKYKNNTLTEASSDVTPYYRHSLDGNLLWQSPFGLQLKAQSHLRLYSAQNTGGISAGYSFSQAVVWKRDDCPVTGEVQGTWFRTDNYDCRVYLSEKNLLYGFTIPMLNGEGIRLSAVLACRMGRHFSLQAKYAHTEYKAAPRRNQLWAQLVSKF